MAHQGTARPIGKRGSRTAGIARACALFALLALATGARADLVAPDDWRKESFEFPLPFAPSLPYQGREQVRFPPSWARFDSEEGFSYVVLWDLKPTLMEAAPLERALAVYFDGLMNNVAIARKIDAMVPQSVVVLHPLAAPEGWSAAYAGEIHTWNAFAKAEPLVLNAEITQRACGAQRMQVFFALSRTPRSSPVWEALRRVRRAASCES